MVDKVNKNTLLQKRNLLGRIEFYIKSMISKESVLTCAKTT